MNRSIDTSLASQPAARSRQRLWWSLALLWMLVIFGLSAQSNFDFISPHWQSDPLSMSAHFVEYGLLALLLWQALRHTPSTARRALAWAFVCTVLYAISDEFHQSFVPGRFADIRDVLVDAAGAAAALWLARRISFAQFRRVK